MRTVKLCTHHIVAKQGFVVFSPVVSQHVNAGKLSRHARAQRLRAQFFLPTLSEGAVTGAKEET